MMSNASVLSIKQAEVNALVTKMSKAKAVVVMEYRGLTVQKTEELRRLLRKEGCELIVAKNNISRRAAEICGFAASTLILRDQTELSSQQKNQLSQQKYYMILLERIQN
jgi:large subunit ribosomal protein L10